MPCFLVDTEISDEHAAKIFRVKTVLLLLLLNYLLTYLPTLWSRVILEKLIVTQLVKHFAAFNGTRRFITAFTSARHLFLF